MICLHNVYTVYEGEESCCCCDNEIEPTINNMKPITGTPYDRCTFKERTFPHYKHKTKLTDTVQGNLVIFSDVSNIPVGFILLKTSTYPIRQISDVMRTEDVYFVEAYSSTRSSVFTRLCRKN